MNEIATRWQEWLPLLSHPSHLLRSSINEWKSENNNSSAKAMGFLCTFRWSDSSRKSLDVFYCWRENGGSYVVSQRRSTILQLWGFMVFHLIENNTQIGCSSFYDTWMSLCVSKRRVVHSRTAQRRKKRWAMKTWNILEQQRRNKAERKSIKFWAEPVWMESFYDFNWLPINKKVRELNERSQYGVALVKWKYFFFLFYYWSWLARGDKPTTNSKRFHLAKWFCLFLAKSERT